MTSFCLQAGRRLTFLGYLSAEKLLINEQFSHFSREFPSKELDETVTVHPTLNKEKFCTELSILYERHDFSEISGTSKLYQFGCCHADFTDEYETQIDRVSV